MNHPAATFPTDLDSIIDRIESIDPVAYGRTRNFLSGAVTRLSPYISRGVISTRFVAESILARGHRFAEFERFLMELAWRDYFQNVWRVREEQVDTDLRSPQTDVEGEGLPSAVLAAETGIEAIDEGIRGLYATGYVHNHVRMYIASVVCNVARRHWREPARWFYYHLLDGDWASNACSWQWVAGTFSSKKYFANQENINKYCGTAQTGTFLDVPYSEIESIPVPEGLIAAETPELRTVLPETPRPEIDPARPTLVYNFYNLDPFWHRDREANRVLLLEPSHFERLPVSEKSLGFALDLARNIDGLKVFAGEFDELFGGFGGEVVFKEHPTAKHYRGTREERDWMFPEVRGLYPSFFAYWKKCERIVKKRI